MTPDETSDMPRMTCCAECAKSFQANPARASRFCSSPCRYAWANRRKMRGAELYDLLMGVRFRRGPAKALGLWSLICRMASIWNEVDKAANRVSFLEPEEARERAGQYLGTVVQRGR